MEVNYNDTINNENETRFCLINDVNQIEAVLSEYQSCFSVLSAGDEFRLKMAKKLSQYAFFIVLQENDKNIGFATLYANDYKNKEGYISFLAISEEYRNKHMGTKLMDQIVKIAREQGMAHIKLEVLKTNIIAQKFYTRYGFRFFGESNKEMFYMVKEIETV